MGLCWPISSFSLRTLLVLLRRQKVKCFAAGSNQGSKYGEVFVVMGTISRICRIELEMMCNHACMHLCASSLSLSLSLSLSVSVCVRARVPPMCHACCPNVRSHFTRLHCQSGRADLRLAPPPGPPPNMPLGALRGAFLPLGRRPVVWRSCVVTVERPDKI